MEECLTPLLGTLTPESADEAVTLIPSLSQKLHADELQPILDELNKMREWECVEKMYKER